MVLAQASHAATWYVSTAGNDAWSGTNWATAKQTIQAAVDLTLAGDTVLVNDGLYSTGGAAAPGTSLPNRVCITSSITVQSVNGPSATTIQGNGPVGAGAVRCVYLGSGAVLSGFTLANGATLSGGGADREGGGVYCGGGAMVTNCTITGCSALYGGGARNGTFYNCTLSGNTTSGWGAGAWNATLNYCTVSGNVAGTEGGGTKSATLNYCTITGNRANYGGGMKDGTANNCLLTGNRSTGDGGASYFGNLNNCTITGNSAGGSGGGTSDGTLRNCINYGNSASSRPNYNVGAHVYCLSSPLPSGSGNITGDPLFKNPGSGDYRLQDGSPCINRGNNGYAPGSTDLDGNPRIINGNVDLGAYESQIVSVSVVESPAGSGVVSGGGNFEVGSTALISAVPTYGHWLFTEWDDGDTNATRSITVPSTDLAFTAVYTQYLAGAVTWYVSTAGNDAWRGTNWATAKRTIQGAVDMTLAGDTVLVNDGLYSTGGAAAPGSSLPNRACVTRAITVRSVNGPSATTIQGNGPVGAGAVRCVYLGSGAVLSGFTLANGATLSGGGADREGGGVYCGGGAIVTNCTITGCSALYGGGARNGTFYNCTLSGNTTSGWGAGAWNATLNYCTVSGNVAGTEGGGTKSATLNYCTITGNRANYGGGMKDGTANNCLLTGNRSTGDGGASYFGNLNNCTITGNSAGGSGGGTSDGTLRNCINYGNSAPSRPNYNVGAHVYCLSSPLPSGSGNITGDPLFKNPGSGDYRLQEGSPCINRGHNGYAPGSTDLDGDIRIFNGTVDLGAYEYSRVGTIFVSW